MILAICDLQVTRYFIASFKSICLPVKEKFKIDFQDGGHLKFLIGTRLTISHRQVTLILATTISINWPVRSGEEVKNTCSRWRPWWPFGVPIGGILAIFYLQVAPILLAKFPVNRPPGSEEDV